MAKMIRETTEDREAGLQGLGVTEKDLQGGGSNEYKVSTKQTPMRKACRFGQRKASSILTFKGLVKTWRKKDCSSTTAEHAPNAGI